MSPDEELREDLAHQSVRMLRTLDPIALRLEAIETTLSEMREEMRQLRELAQGLSDDRGVW